ncbi:MAG: four-helix bundle copper-binding protein [Alphaproteobacteria bacterium]|nr:four-helix bundle copper-binding protein [Alphaproteobacteria bacterium]
MTQRDICHECHDVCLDTLVNHCLEEGGNHVEQQHVKLLMDCIQLCQTSADFMHRNSAHAAAVAQACAEVCDACADSCDDFDSREMKRCAEICRKCADHCREVGGESRRAA